MTANRDIWWSNKKPILIENEDELREADEKICDEKRSVSKTSLKGFSYPILYPLKLILESWTRGTLYELDQVFTKYSQFTGEPSGEMSKVGLPKTLLVRNHYSSRSQRVR